MQTGFVCGPRREGVFVALMNLLSYRPSLSHPCSLVHHEPVRAVRQLTRSDDAQRLFQDGQVFSPCQHLPAIALVFQDHDDHDRQRFHSPVNCPARASANVAWDESQTAAAGVGLQAPLEHLGQIFPVHLRDPPLGSNCTAREFQSMPSKGHRQHRRLTDFFVRKRTASRSPQSGVRQEQGVLARRAYSMSFPAAACHGRTIRIASLAHRPSTWPTPRRGRRNVHETYMPVPPTGSPTLLPPCVFLWYPFIRRTVVLF